MACHARRIVAARYSSCEALMRRIVISGSEKWPPRAARARGMK